MDIYSSATLLGLLGLTAMAFAGVSSSHSSHSGTPAAHGTHGADGTPAVHGTHLSAGPTHSSHATPQHHAPHGFNWLALVSPRVLFALILGFGLTGMILRALLPTPLVIFAALAGAVAFETLLIRPLWTFLLRFQSRPGSTLERSGPLSRAHAATDFNAQGDGLIELEFDGQVRQVLGTLEEGERKAGLRVRRGDSVRILTVDPLNGNCRVSKLAA